MPVKDENTRYQITMSKKLLEQVKTVAAVAEIPLGVWIAIAIKEKIKREKK